MHSTLEWSLKQFNNFAELMIVYALIGVIAVNRKNIRGAYRRSQFNSQPESSPPSPLPPPPPEPELPPPGPDLPPASGADRPDSEPEPHVPATA
jgi:hypothetical protein